MNGKTVFQRFSVSLLTLVFVLTTNALPQQPAPGPSPQDKDKPPQEATKKPEPWDVEGNHGPTSTVEFDTDEGTWMSCDVSPGVEHAIPVAPMYKDALTLFTRSQTQYTPTLIVGYGGIWGENYWYQHSNVYANERLLRFTPRGRIDARARRRLMVPEDDFYHFELARSGKTT